MLGHLLHLSFLLAFRAHGRGDGSSVIPRFRLAGTRSKNRNRCNEDEEEVDSDGDIDEEEKYNDNYNKDSVGVTRFTCTFAMAKLY